MQNVLLSDSYKNNSINLLSKRIIDINVFLIIAKKIVMNIIGTIKIQWFYPVLKDVIEDCFLIYIDFIIEVFKVNLFL